MQPPAPSLPAVKRYGPRSGAAALEFALVSVPFLGLVLGLFTVGFTFYIQFAMDFALQQAVRQVQLGLLPAATTAGTFVANAFCPVFVIFAPCNDILVSIQPVTDYYSAQPVTATTPPTTFCVGQPGQLMYARAVYQAPTLGTIYSIATGPSPGTNGTTIVSSAAFANENPSGSLAGSGC